MEMRTIGLHRRHELRKLGSLLSSGERGRAQDAVADLTFGGSASCIPSTSQRIVDHAEEPAIGTTPQHCFSPMLRRGLQIAGGADCILICSNTMHIIADAGGIAPRSTSR